MFVIDTNDIIDALTLDCGLGRYVTGDRRVLDGLNVFGYQLDLVESSWNWALELNHHSDGCVLVGGECVEL